MNIFVSYPQFPETDKNAGALRVFEVVRLIRELGHGVTFMSTQANEAHYRKALEDIGVECLCDDDRSVVGHVDEFGEYLRGKNFQVAVFVQHFIYNRYAPYFRMLLPECRLVMDALDLEYVRCEREAAVLGTREAIKNASETKRQELAALRDADAVWTVTEIEKQIVLGITPGKRVDVIPTIHHADTELPGFEERSGIVFLGSYRHRPNVDAVEYFMREIFPDVRASLPDVHLLIAGAYPTEDLYRHQNEWTNVRVTGFVEDHRALLKRCRVGIAPLRYGAGMKGKIGEYLGCGLPCVTTSVGAEGIGLNHENEVLIADNSRDFAASIVRLYTDQPLWTRLAQAGADYIHTFSPAAVLPRVQAAIEGAAVVSVKRRSAGLGNVFAIVLRPAEAFRRIGTAARALRRGGFGELVKQIKVWLHRPSS